MLIGPILQIAALAARDVSAYPEPPRAHAQVRSGEPGTDAERMAAIRRIESNPEVPDREKFRDVLRLVLRLNERGPFIWEQVGSEPNWTSEIQRFTSSSGGEGSSRAYLHPWYQHRSHVAFLDKLVDKGYLKTDEMTPARQGFSSTDQVELLEFALGLYDQPNALTGIGTFHEVQARISRCKRDVERERVLRDVQHSSTLPAEEKVRSHLFIALGMKEMEPFTFGVPRREPNWMGSMALLLSQEHLRSSELEYLAAWQKAGCPQRLREILVELNYLSSDARTALKKRLTPVDSDRILAECMSHLCPGSRGH